MNNNLSSLFKHLYQDQIESYFAVWGFIHKDGKMQYFRTKEELENFKNNIKFQDSFIEKINE